MFALSEEELDANDITNLEAFDLRGIPETREVQQPLEWIEKKQAVKTEIQKVEVIIGSLQSAFDTVLALETIQRNSLPVLTDQLGHYTDLKEDLEEKYRLLEQPTEAATETTQARVAM